MNRLLFIILGMSFCTISFGQKVNPISWKAYKKKAEELIELRQYSKAAVALEEAYALKKQRGDLLLKAAEYYTIERDFFNAARVYAEIIDIPKYKDAKLDYANSLKQSNQYEQAMLAFADCLDNAPNPQKEAMINKEIMGCQFALEQEEGYVVKPYGVDIERINTNVNSATPDFAPYQISDTKLYFSSLRDGNARVYTSDLKEGEWMEGKPIKGFAGLKSKHICNEIVSKDETKMYFTICNEDQVWGGLSSRCDIYYSTKKGQAWGQPKMLGPNINYDGATNTQPFVIQTNGEEHIYFSSNRPNGQGGMDLWFASKAANAVDFGQPVNLGPNVNTPGNEITPFISKREKTLYFSSDGHITMGGFDIYKSIGSGFKWSFAENLGMPINTGADEKYYSIANNFTEGYFVSNRIFGEEKPTSTDEDIFIFNVLDPYFFVEGVINNAEELSLVDEAKVYLFELKEKTQDRRLLSVQEAELGEYNFRLLPKRNYQLSVEAPGYNTEVLYVNTNDETVYVQEKNFNLDLDDAAAPVASIVETFSMQEPIATTTTDTPTITEAPIAITQITETTITEAPVIENTIADTPANVSTESPADEVVVQPVVAEVKESFDLNAIEATHETISNEEVIALEEKEVPTQPIVVEVKKEKVVSESFTEVVRDVTENILEEEITEKTVPVSTEAYIESAVISESSNNTTVAENNFVAKGTAKVPSGTGIYKYDDTNDVYKKEGTLLTDKPTSYSEPVNYNSSYNSNTTVPAIEVPLDKYETKTEPFTPSNTVAYDSNAKVSYSLSGTTYQVQLIAVEYHNPSNRRYDGIKNLGLSLNTELIEGKGWTRVLLGSFSSKEEADSILQSARSNGFKRAFVVEYVNGERNRRLK